MLRAMLTAACLVGLAGYALVQPAAQAQPNASETKAEAAQKPMTDTVAIAVIVGLVVIDLIIAAGITVFFRPAIGTHPQLFLPGPGPRTFRIMLLMLILNTAVLLGAGGLLKGEVVTFLGSLAAFVLGGVDLRKESRAGTSGGASGGGAGGGGVGGGVGGGSS